MQPAALLASTLISASAAPFASPAPPAPVAVEQDNVLVSSSCRLEIGLKAIADTEGNGVVQVSGRADGERVVVDLGGATLFGAAGRADAFAGVGITVRGKNVTIRNGRISGYKVAIQAVDCDGLIIEDIDTSDNYAARLKSTAWAEDTSDWLYPHRNDQDEWIWQHGAGIAVKGARGVVIRRVKSLRTQNGIVLDRVNASEIYDNECSFLSGWGIAMWRSSNNTICRNSLDYCIRGYSHGVYNRGQDSAGLLMFEQCSENVVALNSATHCGDGVFGFAGREALGEDDEAESRGAAWHAGRGANRNIFVGNDLSHSAAHGLEMTFSFGNVIARNTFESNAICGVWGGYSRDTVIVGNTFSKNGLAGYGSERGGVNMEHAQQSTVEGNTFSSEPVGVRFWTDEDAALAKLPWAAANGTGARGNRIVGNRFTDCDKAAELLAAEGTLILGNTLEKTPVAFAQSNCTGTVETGSAPARVGPSDAELDALLAKLPGSRKAIGLRNALRGRASIIVLEGGPYSWDRPVLFQKTNGQSLQQFRVLGVSEVVSTSVFGSAPLFAGLEPDGQTVDVRSNQRGFVTPFVLQVLGPNKLKLQAPGLLAPGDWNTKFFALDGGAGKADAAAPAVPTLEALRARAAEEKRELNFRELDFDFRGRAPQDVVESPDAQLLKLEPSRFGITSRSTLRFPQGKFKVHVLSDDGVRLSIDGKPVIERWSIHGTEHDVHEFTVEAMKEFAFELDYFQNEGAARLKVWFEAIDPKIQGVGK